MDKALHIDEYYYNTSKEKKRLDIVLYVLGSLIMLFLIAVQFWTGLVVAIPLFGILWAKSGLEIDFNKKQFRKYISLMGKTLGSWEKIPDLKYISVVRVNMTKKVYQASSDLYVNQSTNNKKYKVNLITTSRDIRFITVLIADKDEAIQEALKIAETLDLRVLDYTTYDKKWIR